jgi:histidinol-phosphate aminotransferase
VLHIRHAIQELTPYRPGAPLRELRRLGIRGGVKLGSNENPLGPAPEVLAAMTAALSEARLYPDPGAPELRAALARRHGRSLAETIAGAGVDDLLDLTVRCILDPDDDLVLAHPGFIRYAVAARSAGGRVTSVPGSPRAPYRHDPEAMLDAMGSRTRIVVLVNPNNPTGSAMTRAELEYFLDRVPDRVLTILDEAYIEFVDDPEHPDGLTYLDRGKPLLVFRTFSKIHSLAGIRIGYGFGPPGLIEHLDRARLPFNVSVIAQAAALAALQAGEHVQRSRALARTETAFLAAELTARGWAVEPTAANFVFARAPVPGDALARGLLEQGFILRPLTSFGLEDRCFRVSHGTREQNLAFLRALDALYPCGR